MLIKFKKIHFFAIGAAFASIVFFVILTTVNPASQKKQVLGQSNKKIIVEKTMINKVPQKRADAVSPQINAKAFYLMDGNNFYPLLGKNENDILPVASTTKMATALVVMENYSKKLNDTVVINSQMVNVVETRIRLLTGEKISIESLLEGLLINSGNDAAYSLAIYLGGLDSFVAEMNAKVKNIGLKKTEFYDPAGLDDRGHSSAKELAVLGAYVLKSKKIAEIVKIPEKTIYSVYGRYAHELINSNRLVKPGETLYLPYAIGVKTGFTYEAGHVLVSAAEKDGHKLIAVVLNTFKDSKPASAEESRKLLEWGFNNWTW